MWSRFAIIQRIATIPVLVFILGLSYVLVPIKYVAIPWHRYHLYMHFSDHSVKCMFVLQWKLSHLTHVEEKYDAMLFIWQNISGYEINAFKLRNKRVLKMDGWLSWVSTLFQYGFVLTGNYSHYSCKKWYQRIHNKLTLVLSELLAAMETGSNVPAYVCLWSSHYCLLIMSIS